LSLAISNTPGVLVFVVVGFMIGSSIGSIGRVSSTLSDEVAAQIETNINMIESKQAELESLNNEKSELETMVNN